MIVFFTRFTSRPSALTYTARSDKRRHDPAKATNVAGIATSAGAMTGSSIADTTSRAVAHPGSTARQPGRT
jgi:hypothetical protein